LAFYFKIVQYVIASIIKHDDRIDEDFRLEMISATQNQFGWVNDLCTVALPAWLLLWVSPTFRQTLMCVMNPLLNLMCRYIRHWIYGTNGNHQQRNTNKPKVRKLRGKLVGKPQVYLLIWEFH
jgi:hypothetical protein